MRYPVRLTAQEVGNYAVSFPDIPEALTRGDTAEEAMRHGADALESALDFYFENNRMVPMPSAPKRGQRVIELSPTLAGKVLLFNELLAQKVRPADLARRMAIPRQQVTRLLNPRHATKIDSIALALRALGKELQLSVG